MAKKVTAYADRKGQLHLTQEAATLNDIAAILGNAAEGMTIGLARLIYNKRQELESVFAEHDASLPEGDEAPVEFRKLASA